jgi:2-amino-4-hydroxy-6-hydroxymethyldihydropteridine diphosphokinase
MPHTAYLSLGSNVGDRDANLHEAIRRLQAFSSITAVSTFYETEPVEFMAQDWFLNCVVQLETEQTPRDLLQSILDTEQSMGRKRTQSKGPRNIDIDILLFDDFVVNDADLTIPHPAMHQRRFVLAPFAEIAPNVQHPVLHKTAKELLEALPAGQAVRKINTKAPRAR